MTKQAATADVWGTSRKLRATAAPSRVSGTLDKYEPQRYALMFHGNCMAHLFASITEALENILREIYVTDLIEVTPVLERLNSITYLIKMYKYFLILNIFSIHANCYWLTAWPEIQNIRFGPTFTSFIFQCAKLTC